MELDQFEVKLLGHSMEPILKEGDICIVINTVAQAGDIVCLRNKETKEFIIHRLYDESTLITKGDNSLYYDDPSIHSYIGKVHSIRRIDHILLLKSSYILCLIGQYRTQENTKLMRGLAKLLIKLIQQ